MKGKGRGLSLGTYSWLVTTFVHLQLKVKVKLCDQAAVTPTTSPLSPLTPFAHMDVQMFALWKAKWYSSFAVVIWPCFECVFWASCITAMWQFLVGPNIKKKNLHNNINNNNGNDDDDDDDQRNSRKLQLTSCWRQRSAANCENVLELCIKWWAGLFAAAVSFSFSLPASFKVVQFVLTKSNGKFYKFP